MFSSLGDPYSTYLTGDNYKAFMEQTSGEYGGVGIVFGENNEGKIYVLNVFEKSAAHDAGVKTGGQLLAVDGESVEGKELKDVAQHVRGEAGTKVTLTLLENGEQKDYEITRSNITMPTVTSDMAADNIGYIHIYGFATHTPDEFGEALNKLKSEGATKLIIDLRMNPGGLVDSAVAIADKILTKGPVVSFQLKNHPLKTYEINGVDKPMPMVILIDKNSASASEILAGAVQDRKEGTIMGETSFGKGTVQNIIPEGDTSAMKISIAQYLTANGRIIDKKGITPDVPIEQTGTPFDPATDNVLQEAIAELQGQ